MDRGRRGADTHYYRENVVVSGGQEGIPIPLESRAAAAAAGPTTAPSHRHADRAGPTHAHIASTLQKPPAAAASSSTAASASQHSSPHTTAPSHPSTRHRKTNSKSTATASLPPTTTISNSHNNNPASSSSHRITPRANKRQSATAGLTFYREDTPSPPPSPTLTSATPTTTAGRDLDSKSGFINNAAAGGFYDYRYDRVAPQAPIPQVTICGVRRRIFWAIVAAALLVVGLGVGIGLGLGLQGADGPESTEPGEAFYTGAGTFTNSPITSPTSSSAPSATTSSASSSSSSSSSSITALSCPEADNTEYHVPDYPDKVFRRHCGIDYSGPGAADDITGVWTRTMEACMAYCAGLDGCTGCGWGVIASDPGSEHRCWLKKDLGDEPSVKKGWQFAILEE